MGLRRLGRGKMCLAALILGAWPLVTAPLGAAPADDVFTMTGVAVDAEAETAAVARELALAEGQREAFGRLLKRITMRTDYGAHPVPDEAVLTALVRGLEIAEEKTSSIRYLAKLTISFKKDAVRRLLRERGLAFSETFSKPILVLPVYEIAGTRILWDDPNPWRDAWLAREKRDTLVPLMVPTGDLSDIATISPAQAVAGDAERLDAIAARYEVEDTLVARASLSFDLAAGAPRLELSSSQHGPSSGNQVIVESVVGASREVIDELLVRAAESITLALEERWKRDTQLRFDRQTRLGATVPLAGLGDWLTVRRRLGAVAMVRKVELNSLSKTNAQIVLHYLGDPEQLAISLAQRDLDLARDGGFWTIKPRRTGARPVPEKPTSAVAR